GRHGLEPGRATDDPRDRDVERLARPVFRSNGGRARARDDPSRVVAEIGGGVPHGVEVGVEIDLLADVGEGGQLLWQLPAGTDGLGHEYLGIHAETPEPGAKAQ